MLEVLPHLVPYKYNNNFSRLPVTGDRNIDWYWTEDKSLQKYNRNMAIDEISLEILILSRFCEHLYHWKYLEEPPNKAEKLC